MTSDESRRDDADENGSHGEAADGSDSHGTPEPGGLGKDGTIPADPDGVAAGHTGTASTFEPEEDEGSS
ncbi:MAG: hypothetical protein PGN24_00670 [Microbacterium arborescens]